MSEPLLEQVFASPQSMVSSPAPKRRVVVIVNASAGSVAANPADVTPERLQEAFLALGCEAQIVSVPGRRMARAARRAAASGVDAVVAAGGDGTVSAVAGALVSGTVPLGVLPVGTLNHFAKDLTLPLDLDGAIRTIATGHIREIDVAEVNGHAFVNNSSVGVYPAVVRFRDDQRERTGQSKWTAMAVAVFRVLRRFPLMRVRLDINGQPAIRVTPAVFVGNNEYSMSLFTRGQRSCLDSGKLCVYIVNCRRRWCVFRLALRALFRRLDQAKDFESDGTTELWIEHHRTSLYVALDGEIRRLRTPLHYRIRPRALRVLVPEPQDAAPSELSK